MDPQPDDAVIEVGPGLGDLTCALAAASRRVLALELDHGLVRALEHSELPDNVEVRQGDALRADWRDLVRELGGPTLLVGNLPYNVAGRLIGGLLLGGWHDVFRRMGFMMQAEVAERLIARPGQRAYGSLAVWAGLFSSSRRALELGPGAFVPRPKVDSTFVVIDPPPMPPPRHDLPTLQRVVTLALRFRRKTLRRALAEFADPEALAEAFDTVGIDGQRRGETLSGQEFIALAGALENADA